MASAADIARNPELFAAWEREQLIKRAALRVRLWRLAVVALVLVPVVLGLIGWRLVVRADERARDDQQYEECVRQAGAARTTYPWEQC